MFGRDVPRQPEKRFRFLIGQCQLIFPSTTIFLQPPPFPRDRRTNALRAERVGSSYFSSLLVDLYRYSAQQRPERVVQMRRKSRFRRERTRKIDLARSASIGEQYFKRPSRVAASPARPPCRAMYIHSSVSLPPSPPLPLSLSFPSSQLHPIRIAVHIVNDTRWKPARHESGRYRRHEYIFVILYFALRLSPPTPASHPADYPEDRSPFVDTTVRTVGIHSTGVT